MHQPDRLQPSGLNSLFEGDGASFPEYVVRMRAMLARVHRGGDALARIEGNAPFDLQPQTRDGRDQPFRRGILLVHGLGDSPYHMRYLAAFFQAQGFRVMALLLPGHGTVPGDLLEVRWQEWAKAVMFGVNCLEQEVDELYLGGFSLGGTLCLRHSLLDARVRGLFLFAPALKISPLARFAGLHKLYSWLQPSARWLEVLPDRDLYKYETFAMNAVAQTAALLAELRPRLHRHLPELPVFAAASQDDATVDTIATFDFIAALPNTASRLVIYTTDPHQFAAMPRVEALDSALPGQRILSSAHTAIVIAPEDEHYGRDGRYANCLHYYRRDPARYKACWDRQQEAWQGELTRSNLRSGLLRRLTYNPRFAALQESMQRFIATLPERKT